MNKNKLDQTEQNKTPKRHRKWIISAVAVLLAVVLVIGLIIPAGSTFSTANFTDEKEQKAAEAIQSHTDYLQQNLLEQKAAYLQALLAPKTYEGSLSRASIAIANEDYETAASALEDAISVYPGDNASELSLLYLRLGSLYVLLKRSTDAMTQINKAISLDPNSADAYFLLMEMDYEAGEFEKAAEDGEKLEKLTPLTEEISESLLQIYGAASRNDDVIRLYEGLLSKNYQPKTELRYWMGQVYTAENKPEKALAELEAVLKEKPDFEGAAYYGAFAAFSLSKYERAVELFGKAIEQGAEVQASYYYRAISML